MLGKFELFMPVDFQEACALKAAGAMPVAGGTDVYVNRHGGKERTAQIVDLKQLKGGTATSGSELYRRGRP